MSAFTRCRRGLANQRCGTWWPMSLIAQQWRHLDPGERVARTERRRRGDGAQRGSTGRDDADRRELARPGERKQREQTTLQDREPRGDARRTEGDSVRTNGERDTQCVANRGTIERRHWYILTQAPRDTGQTGRRDGRTTPALRWEEARQRRR